MTYLHIIVGVSRWYVGTLALWDSCTMILYVKNVVPMYHHHLNVINIYLGF